MKKILIFISVLAFILPCLTLSIYADDPPLNWYCVRNKDHKQPIADCNMRFIEDFDGYYIDHTHGDSCDEKVIYLTFDAGYENGNISKILDVLKAQDVKATFFILENLIIKNPALVKRMADEGHIVANHTTKHADVTKYSSLDDLRSDLEALEKLYYQETGYIMPKFFRCPEGRFSKRSMEYLKELGYKTIFWSFAYADWDNNAQPAGAVAKEKILSNVHNGEIMLLHPTSKTNAEILDDVIIELKEQGFRFGTLDELTKG